MEAKKIMKPLFTFIFIINAIICNAQSDYWANNHDRLIKCYCCGTWFTSRPDEEDYFNSQNLCPCCEQAHGGFDGPSYESCPCQHNDSYEIHESIDDEDPSELNFENNRGDYEYNMGVPLIKSKKDGI